MEQAHLSWKDQFFISPLGQWIDQHRNLLWNVGTAFLVIVIWGSIQMSRSRGADSLRNVNEAVAAWKTKMDDASYHHMEKMLNPSMRLAMRSEMAQRLLNAGQCDEAQKWASAPLQDLRSLAPLHAEFAEISLLIGRQHYQEAIERSVSLKEKMQGQESVLVGRNLLRIAILHQQMGNRAGEIAAWKTWEEWTQNNQTLQALALKGLWDSTTISFQSYVNERMN